MRDVLTYGPGIPRYLALWLPLFPLVVTVLAIGRVRRGAAVAVLASTLPTFLLHTPPQWPVALRWVALAAPVATVVVWLVVRVRGDELSTEAAARPVPWAAALALAAVAVALRVPLAWLDPGIGDFALSSEAAAETLLDGVNPYTVTNPHATYGTYQYPAGTLLVHLPFVAADPGPVLGEEHLGARAVAWVTDAAAVLVLVIAGARVGHPRGGLVAGALYALHPTVVRESGIVVANDLLLTLLAVGVAVALARDRRLAAGLLAGAAIAVKPAALALVPVVLLAAGPLAAGTSLALPAALQAPFLLWPSVGGHGLAAIAEPVARAEPLVILRYSLWYPLYAAGDGADALVRTTAVVGAALVGVAAVAAGLALRRRARTLSRTAVAVALPLAIAFATASVMRHNYQDWYLGPFLLAAGLAAGRPR